MIHHTEDIVPATCPNLRELFGDRYRIVMEESFHAERRDLATTDDPWLQTIPCEFGHLYPHGGNKIGAATSGRGSVAKALRSLPCVEVRQLGDDGVNVIFDVADLAIVADVMRPKRRRPPRSDAQKAHTAALAKRYGFPPAKKREFNEQRPASDAPADTKAHPAGPMPLLTPFASS
jgi:hypothetical protein